MQICDEAHRCAGRSTKRDAQPLSDGFLRASRRLFLTATPRPLGAKRDKEGELLAVASMDDQALFGRVAYRLAYSDAVARRIVAPLKLVFLDLTKLAEEYRLAPQPASSLVALGDAGGDVASRELAELSAALLDCHRQHGVRTAFAFCANNARAAELERVARRSLAAHGVALGRVSGRMSAPARAQVLDPVRRAASSPLPAEPGNGSMAIVTNCRVLGEGVDLPAVDLVVFADAKQRCVQDQPPSSLAHCASTHPAACACARDRSHVDILQCMGRASRLSPGKEYGHVLVPMAEEDESAFEAAVSVVRAYAEQDEELKEALAFLVAEEARLGRPLQREEWPEVLQAAIELPADAMSVQRMLGERLVATVAVELVDRWERMYGLLQAYRAREGSANVPAGHEEGGERLGEWLSRQRRMHKAGRMAGERSRRLEAVGVVWDAVAAQWEKNYALLRAFVEREGHANVPRRHEEDGERLGRWLSRQRKRWQARGMSEEARKAKSASALSDEEVARLDAVGVVWQPRRAGTSVIV